MAAVGAGFALYGSFIVVIGLVQAPREIAGYGFGADVLEAGLFLLPGSTIQLFSARPVTWLARRFDARAPIAVGALIVAASLGALAGAHDQRWQVYACLLVNGIGAGLVFSSLPGRIVEAVPQSQTGIATGMNAIMRTIGQAVGAAVVSSLLAARLVDGTRFPVESAYTAALGLAAGFALLGAGLVYLGPAYALGRGPDALLEPEAVGVPALAGSPD